MNDNGHSLLLEWISWLTAWLLFVSFIIAGVVDLVIGYSRQDTPDVSDWVHFALVRHPWMAALFAALAYHLLIGRPAPPWK